jgi:hypothetical protein
MGRGMKTGERARSRLEWMPIAPIAGWYRARPSPVESHSRRAVRPATPAVESRLGLTQTVS